MGRNDASIHQVNVLRWAPFLPAVLSILGSVFIVQRIIRSQKLLNKTYERLMLGLSIVDILCSVRMIIFPLAFWPFYEPSKSCTMDGFLITMCFAGPLYNAVLSLYYVLVIVYNVPAQRIAKRYECAFHATAIGYGVGGASLGLLLNVYNPEKDKMASCWVSEWPYGCGDDDFPCERGAWAALFSYSIGVVPLVGVLLVLVISNASIYWTVREIVAKTKKYIIPSIEATSIAEAALAESSVEDAEKPRTDPTKGRSSLGSRPTSQTVSKTTAVAVQSISYVLAYFLCFIWCLILIIVGVVDPSGMKQGNYFALSVVQMIFYPAQGLCNASVYFRPMVARMRRQDPNRSAWKVLQTALLDTPE